MKMPVIECSHLSKVFEIWEGKPSSIKEILAELLRFNYSLGKKIQKVVITDLSFKIDQGEFVGIMGRNGVGKSTFLKLISNIYKPTSGQIHTRGKIVPLLELGAGFSPDLSGYENIFLNASILGFSKSEIESNLKNIIEFAELGENLYQPVKNYSSGMLVRLGFSVAAHVNADILLFDEILAVGDAGFQKKCLNKIEELSKLQKTIILVTHSVDQVVKFCNRCIVFDRDGVIFDGNPEVGVQKYGELF